MKNYDLIFPMKKKWYDMILSGKKKEEYREEKKYWGIRILNAINARSYTNQKDLMENFNIFKVKFINGYGKSKPYFIAKCRLQIKIGGNEKWGAEPDVWYYTFKILKIIPQEIK